MMGLCRVWGSMGGGVRVWENFNSKMKPEQFWEVSETRLICPKSQIGWADIWRTEAELQNPAL